MFFTGAPMNDVFARNTLRGGLAGLALLLLESRSVSLSSAFESDKS
jgi:hypothetical protein